MLGKFLIIGGITLAVWLVIAFVFALSSWLNFDIPDWLGISFYIIASYLAPVAFIVAVIGSVFCLVKSRARK